MKKILLLAVLLLSSAAVWAAKPTVYVEPFYSNQDYSDAWLDMVRSSVIEAINKSNRAHLVDADTEVARMKEELRRVKAGENEGADVESTQALQTLGSHMILNGDVTAFNIKCSTLESGTKSYDASVVFTLKLVDALDGKTISTETFTFPKQGFMGVGAMAKGLTKGVMESEDAAVTSLKGDITGGLKKYIDKSFPLEAEVEAIDESKGKEAKTLYINVGKKDGVAKGNKFDVRGGKKIGKKPVYKTVGEVEVVEVDEDMSLCKVKKGGVEITEAYESGLPVLVRTQEK